MILENNIDQNYSGDEEINSDSSASINDDGSFPEEVEHDEELELDEKDEESEISQLRKWAIDCKVPHAHLDKLLGILSSRLLPNLPKSSKTFLSTSSAKYLIVPMVDSDGSEGEFVYFGKAGLIACIDPKEHDKEIIYLQINIDGIPLFKSSAKMFWPILCRVYFDPMIFKPFPVAIYSGNSKPKILSDFLQQFVLEINELQAEGCIIRDKHFQVKIQSFICNTPARSFLKCTQGHSGFNACERCGIRGEKVNKVTVFISPDNRQERTDESFRNFNQPSHHTNASPLLLIYPPIDMIKQFILDFMHLGPLGVMKRLLLDYWTSKNLKIKMSQKHKTELSRRLEYIRPCIPVDFQRKPRTLHFLAKWKATEFMIFLLYYGPIILKGLISDVQYKHFLLLHMACRLLCMKYAPEYHAYAKDYLTTFVNIASHIYDPEFVVINVHNLCHLADDVANMNCSLFNLSAFSFENYLGKIKRKLNSAYRPLAQYCNRLHEENCVKNKLATKSPKFEILKKINDSKILELKYKEAILSTKFPNNIVRLDDERIFQLEEIFLSKENILNAKGKIVKIIKSVYSYPSNSNITKMWKVQSGTSTLSVTVPLDNIEGKVVLLRVNFDSQKPERAFALSLIHQ